MMDFNENNIKNYNYPEMIVLGSTGSVGTQAVDVAVRQNIPVIGISAGKNVDLAESQARQLHVKYCAMSDINAAKDLRVKLADTAIQVFEGPDGITNMLSVAKSGQKQVVQNAITGRAGLEPTLVSIQNGYRLALANKESLVVAGHIVMDEVAKYHTELVPVDSEHSAIYQCMRAGNPHEVKTIWLTASGGPFKGMHREELQGITKERALAHPTWKMGPKITIDSATLMNKGFEVIEAVHLFHVNPTQIHVVVHKESIIHSMVEYIDHSIIAQLSKPDMRECVQYAMTDPLRMPASIDPLDITKVGSLTFTEPDMKTFKLLPCAIHAIERGGALPAVLNAANEVAVDAFLNNRLSFCGIMDVVCEVVEKLSGAQNSLTLDAILEFDKEARHITNEIISSQH